VDKNRFASINTSFPYEPPLDPQATPPVLSFSQLSSETATQVHSVENSDTVGVVLSAGLDLKLFSLTLKDDLRFTWTSKSATTTSSSDAQAASLTIAGPSFGYTGPMLYDVYWDRLYGAFVFVPREASPAGGDGQQK
jgi:hypothetical protein